MYSQWPPPTPSCTVKIAFFLFYLLVPVTKMENISHLPWFVVCFWWFSSPWSRVSAPSFSAWYQTRGSSWCKTLPGCMSKCSHCAIFINMVINCLLAVSWIPLAHHPLCIPGNLRIGKCSPEDLRKGRKKKRACKCWRLDWAGIREGRNAKGFFFLLFFSVVRADGMIAAFMWNWSYIQEWYLYAWM